MTNRFIVFSTLSQAKNYIKRNLKSYHHDEGCGCCYNYASARIQGKRIVYVNVHSYVGDLSTEVTVIGRYKR